MALSLKKLGKKYPDEPMEEVRPKVKTRPWQSFQDTQTTTRTTRARQAMEKARKRKQESLDENRGSSVKVQASNQEILQNTISHHSNPQLQAHGLWDVLKKILSL